MEKNNITVEELDYKYYLSHNKCYPADFQNWICRNLNIQEDDYIKFMEEQYNGQYNDFDIIEDDYDENDNRYYRVVPSCAICFENIDAANKAKDWVEAQILAKKMSESQMLIGIDWSDANKIKIDPVFVDYNGLLIKSY